MNRHEFVRRIRLSGYEKMKQWENEQRELYIHHLLNMPMVILRPNNTIGFDHLGNGPPNAKNQYSLTDAMLIVMALLPEKDNERKHDDRNTEGYV